MKHITEVLVHSNRCEVINGHIFTVGDSGLPHIRLKFLYMFELSTLVGKTLECKYILPNGKYSMETVRMTKADEVLFPIHYSCFTVSGWTKLRISLVNGNNKITLEDIIIKTKSNELGERFSSAQIENAINQTIAITTDSIRAEGNSIKTELANYIQRERNNLRGEPGQKGERGLQGIQGPPGLRGEPGIAGRDGKNLEFNWNGTRLGIRQQGDTRYQYVDLKGNDGTAYDSNELNTLTNKVNDLISGLEILKNTLKRINGGNQ